MRGHLIGNSPSWTWYGNQPIPDATHPPPTLPPLPLSDAYEAAQAPGSGFYNAYASYLNNSRTPVTDAYGFPYTDRLASPLASLDDNTVLTMTILPDDSGSPPSGWVITVPAPTTQAFADLLVGPTASSMLTVTGGGTAIFSAANTYSGGTTIINGTAVEVTNSNPGISSSIGTGALTLDEGNPRGRGQQPHFQQRCDADRQRRDLRLERRSSDLERSHFGRWRADQDRSRDHDPGPARTPMPAERSSTSARSGSPRAARLARALSPWRPARFCSSTRTGSRSRTRSCSTPIRPLTRNRIRTRSRALSRARAPSTKSARERSSSRARTPIRGRPTCRRGRSA